jgi:RNA polymerase sigma-70 factor (ECF subfamily)
MDGERQLLTAWRAGDCSKGQALFERYFDCMYRFFSTKVDGADVADLVQRTFLACVEASDSFRGEASVRSFFFGIARNQLRRYYRTRSRSLDLDFGVSSVADLAPSPSSALARGQRAQLLAEALRHIPVDLQIALELRYVEGLRGPELASALAIPEGTVRSRLRRGLAAVRERVETLSQSPEECRRALGGVEEWEKLDAAAR